MIKKIKDEHVIEFLKNNPKFFIENSSLLDEILFPLILESLIRIVRT